LRVDEDEPWREGVWTVEVACEYMLGLRHPLGRFGGIGRARGIARFIEDVRDHRGASSKRRSDALLIHAFTVGALSGRNGCVG